MLPSMVGDEQDYPAGSVANPTGSARQPRAVMDATGGVQPLNALARLRTARRRRHLSAERRPRAVPAAAPLPAARRVVRIAQAAAPPRRLPHTVRRRLLPPLIA